MGKTFGGKWFAKHDFQTEINSYASLLSNIFLFNTLEIQKFPLRVSSIA